jgi:hypothetical protein
MRRAIPLLMLAAFLAKPSAEVGAANDAKPSVVRVSKDGHALEIKRSKDPAVQRVDVLAKCGLPVVGEPRIREYKDQGGTIAVTYGKHCFADVSLIDLSVRCTGCD